MWRGTSPAPANPRHNNKEQVQVHSAPGTGQESQPIDHNDPKGEFMQINTGTLIAIGAALYLGLGFLLFKGIIAEKRLSDKYAPETVKTVPCKIQVCQFSHKTTSRRGVTHYFEVRFAYEFENRNYLSTKYSSHNDFISTSDPQNPGQDFVKVLLDRYKPGTETVCYVNPKYPEQAVLAVRAPMPAKKWLRHPLVLLYFGSLVFVVAKLFSGKN
jgi:hypothetical protein